MGEPPYEDTVSASADTRAILLLLTKFGQAQEVVPLKPREYERLARWLQSRRIHPRDLLDADAFHLLNDAALPIPLPRLRALLERHTALQVAVDRWAAKGLWIINPMDDHYPCRLVDQSHFSSPPLLYGAGNSDLLSAGGLAIVGSRHADDEALDFTRNVARACAEQDIVVVSGGARGIDSAAMDAALQAGGRVVGVLADSLAKTIGLPKYQDALRGGTLVLVSPYQPEHGFNIGQAMGRNKHVYHLADWGLVVSTSLESGGTWAGAVEALRHRRHVFVRVQETAPEGNQKLRELGAYAFPDSWLGLATTLSNIVLASPRRQRQTAYDIVLPLLLSHLEQPRDLPTIARLLDVHQNQALAWVKKAIKDRRIEKEDGAELPRYSLSPQQRMPFVAESKEEYVASDGLHVGDDAGWIGITEALQLLGVESEQTVEAWTRLGLLRSRKLPGGSNQVLLEDVLRRRAKNESLIAIGGEELTAEELNTLKRERPGTNPWERDGTDQPK